MRVIIIGNSHVPVLSNRYKKHPLPNIDMTFFTKAGMYFFPSLEIDKRGVLVSDDAEVVERIADAGLKDVPLSDFDVVIVYGGSLRSRGMGRKWAFKLRDSKRALSAEVREIADRGYVEGTAHFQFLKKLKSVGILEKTRCISMPSPFPNEAAPFMESVPNIDKSYIQGLENRIQRMVEELGVEYLDTPEILKTESGFTTRRAFKKERVDDFAHLNSAGGQLVLDHIEARLLSGAE